jgi:hypothetical protein
MTRSCARYGVWVLAAVALSFAPANGARGAEFLTAAEQEFFGTLPVKARLEGRAIERKLDTDALAAIGNRAPQPLQARVLAIARDYSQLQPSPEEMQQFEKLVQEAAVEAQKQLRGVAKDALLDKKPDSVKATKAIFSDPSFKKALEMLRGWSKRTANAQADMDKNFQLIASDLAKRAPATRSASDLALTLDVEGTNLVLSGKAGARPLGSPIVRVVLEKDKLPPGGLTAFGVGAGAWLQAKYGFELDLPAEAENSAEMEKIINQPTVVVAALPDVAPGRQLSIDLGVDARDALFYEQVNVQVWSAQGTLTITDVPGLKGIRDRRDSIGIEEPPKLTGSLPGAISTVPMPMPGTFEPMPGSSPLGLGSPRAPAPGTSKLPAATSNPLGLGSPLGGPGSGAGKPLTRAQKAQQTRLQEQQERVRLQQAKEALANARAAMAKKQDDVARVFLRQAIALAPDSPTSKSATALLKKIGE